MSSVITPTTSAVTSAAASWTPGSSSLVRRHASFPTPLPPPPFCSAPPPRPPAPPSTDSAAHLRPRRHCARRSPRVREMHLSPPPPNDQRNILPAKPKAIAQRKIALRRPGL